MSEKNCRGREEKVQLWRDAGAFAPAKGFLKTSRRKRTLAPYAFYMVPVMVVELVVDPVVLLYNPFVVMVVVFVMDVRLSARGKRHSEEKNQGCQDRKKPFHLTS